MAYFFLDTEWADAAGRELVSLAMVSEDGRRKVYVERDPLPLPDSDFVQHVVYPLLERGPTALAFPQLAERVRAFMEICGVAEVFADHPNDFALLRGVLAHVNPVPWVPILVEQSDVLGHLETYFDRHPELRRFRHHAAIDADALRWAFSYVNDGIA